MKAIYLFVLILSHSAMTIDGGPVTMIAGYGACQTACNAGYVVCCSSAGATAGVLTLGFGVPAAIAACSAIQAACMAACAAAFLVAPTP